MFRRTIKRTMKKMVQKTRNYLSSLEEEEKAEKRSQENHNYDGDFAYLWLNSEFTKLLSEKRCAERPYYAYGVLNGAHLAKAIGIKRVSVLEFGVAGGNGLISLEKISEKVEEIFEVGIDVYGFDTGRGLPKPMDYRDCPNLWSPGFFSMDQEKLQEHLQRARLVLGSVEDTIPGFIQSKPSPIAFIAFDLDFYSSTMHAFKVLEADQVILLPRIHCYFDDIIGFTYSDYTGERLAISEFNDSHTMRKLSPIYGLRHFLPRLPAGETWWAEMFYMAHIFDHDLYCRSDGLVRDRVGGFTALKGE